MKSSTLSPAARAFASLKAGKPQRKLRKHSLQPIPRLKKKADRALQDFYRREYPNARCESCPAPFQLMHHAIEKSACAGLRFEESNLVFLCHKCHARHHLRGDPEVMAEVCFGRGQEWFRGLQKLKIERKGMQLDRQFLEEQLLKYK